MINKKNIKVILSTLVYVVAIVLTAIFVTTASEEAITISRNPDGSLYMQSAGKDGAASDGFEVKPSDFGTKIRQPVKTPVVSATASTSGSGYPAY